MVQEQHSTTVIQKWGNYEIIVIAQKCRAAVCIAIHSLRRDSGSYHVHIAVHFLIQCSDFESGSLCPDPETVTTEKNFFRGFGLTLNSARQELISISKILTRRFYLTVIQVAAAIACSLYSGLKLPGIDSLVRTPYFKDFFGD